MGLRLTKINLKSLAWKVAHHQCTATVAVRCLGKTAASPLTSNLLKRPQPQDRDIKHSTPIVRSLRGGENTRLRRKTKSKLALIVALRSNLWKNYHASTIAPLTTALIVIHFSPIS